MQILFYVSQERSGTPGMDTHTAGLPRGPRHVGVPLPSSHPTVPRTGNYQGPAVGAPDLLPAAPFLLKLGKDHPFVSETARRQP